MTFFFWYKVKASQNAGIMRESVASITQFYEEKEKLRWVLAY